MALHRTSFYAGISIFFIINILWLSTGAWALPGDPGGPAVPSKFAASPGSQETGTLSGGLFGAGGDEPVPWAWIRLKRWGSSAAAAPERNIIAGEDGTFIAGLLEPGRYWVDVSHVSYYTLEPVTVEIKPGETSEITLFLSPRIYRQPAVITKAGLKRERLEGPGKVIHRDDLSQSPGVFEDPLRVLATTPGVEIQSDFDGRLSFRGGSPAEAGYSLDGIPIPMAYHLGGLTSIFHPSAVEEIHSFASGHPASLGPGTAGYVQVNTRTQFGARHITRLEASPITIGGLWYRESTDGCWNTLLALRRTYHDMVLKALGKEEGITVPNFFDGQIQVHWRPAEQHTFWLRMLRSGDRASMGLAGISGAATTNTITITGDLSRTALGWDGKWDLGKNRHGGGGFKLAYQPYEYDMRVAGADAESMDWNAEAYIVTAHAFLQQEHHRIEIGSMAIRQELTYNVEMARGFWKLWSGPSTESSLTGDPVTFSDKGHRDTGYRALYFQERWMPGNGSVAITGGLREEFYAASKEHLFSPRLSLEYSFGSVTLHTAWGIYRGHPLDQPGEPPSTRAGLRARASEHVVLGVTNDMHKYGSLGVQLYSRRSERLLSEVDPGVFLDEGKGRAYGMDAEWRRRGRRWRLGINYSYGRSLRRDPGGPLLKTAIEDPSGNHSIAWEHGPDQWYPGPYDLGHSIRLLARAGLGAGVHLDISWAYRSGRRTTPVRDIVWDADGRVFGIEGHPGSARLPAYHRLDVRLEKVFRTGWGTVETYAEVANLYNRSNVFQSNYNKEYTGRNDYLMLPLIPIAGVAVEF